MLPVPKLDERNYQEILKEALARIPVHNPEWTNFNKSDPGVTLLELFAFMTENLIYRANLIPKRNQRKFLSLLGVGVAPGASAQGLVTIANGKGPLQTELLPSDLELRAGSVPFRTARPVEVLPLEARVHYKRPSAIATSAREAFDDLFASFFPGAANADLKAYTTALLEAGGEPVDLASETVDGSLWVALLLRQPDAPSDPSDPEAWDRRRLQVQQLLANKVLSLGVVPDLSEAERDLPVGGDGEAQPLLTFALPLATSDPIVEGSVRARYKPLTDVAYRDDVLTRPGTVEITLPEAAQLDTWRDLEPLEAGVGDLPPVLDEDRDAERLLTWIRVRAPAATKARIGWVGINAVAVHQRTWVRGERLPEGTGEPDQTVTLSNTPVVPETLRLSLSDDAGSRDWQRLEDLMSADPEVPVPDLRQPPGSQQGKLPRTLRNEVFTLDPTSGQIRFGDGFHGKRPPLGAAIRADYAYGLGAAGNVGGGQIDGGPGLPAGFTASNPVRTWGGAAAETVATAAKTVPRFLQHRDRLVTAADFATLVRQTPGVDVGRVEVLPAYNPDLSESAPGDAPGAVTLMVIPRNDPTRPDAPLPDRLFLEAVCRHLEPRRLITTEVLLRPPNYRSIWVSVGLEVVSGVAFATVREAVQKALRRFLSPLPAGDLDPLESDRLALSQPQEQLRRRGWPLGKPVLALELLAEVSRVPGVKLVNTPLLLGVDNQGPMTEVTLEGLELPRLVGLSVQQGTAVALDVLRGQQADAPETRPFLPVPFAPEECE